MSYKLLIASIILASSNFFSADVDYFRCNWAAGLYGMHLDNDGKLQTGFGQKIISKSTNENIEKFVIETDPTAKGIQRI